MEEDQIGIFLKGIGKVLEEMHSTKYYLTLVSKKG